MVVYPYRRDINKNMAFVPKTTKERIDHRLKISLGHLEKIIRMVADDAYCIDVMHQIQAVEEALKESGNLILENHLKTCASDAIKKGNSAQAIAEIMEVMKKRSV